MPNNVDHPQHYNAHPSGVECITIIEHMCFNLGNAIKYIWRADLKENTEQDLEKAVWYIQRELKRRKSVANVNDATCKKLGLPVAAWEKP